MDTVNVLVGVFTELEILTILSPAPIKHKGWGKSWHKLNADLESDSEMKKGLSTPW